MLDTIETGDLINVWTLQKQVTWSLFGHHRNKCHNQYLDTIETGDLIIVLTLQKQVT